MGSFSCPLNAFCKTGFKAMNSLSCHLSVKLCIVFCSYWIIVKEIINENFLELRIPGTEIQEAHRVPIKIDPIKENSKATLYWKWQNLRLETGCWKYQNKKRGFAFKGKSIRCAADLSNEILQARRMWNDIVQQRGELNTPLRILYPPRFLYRFGTFTSSPLFGT